MIVRPFFTAVRKLLGGELGLFQSGRKKKNEPIVSQTLCNKLSICYARNSDNGANLYVSVRQLPQGVSDPWLSS